MDRMIAGSGPLKMPLAPQLDGLRAIAVAIVMVSHFGLGKIVPGGLGVTIFFFLSGFLITSLLRAEAATNGRVYIGQFFLRRFLRIFPPLYIVLATVAVLVATGLLRYPLSGLGIASQLLFFPNYARWYGVDGFLPGPPLWSLAVEEHFYLVFPFLFAFVLMRTTPPRAALVCALLCVIPLLLRIQHGLSGDVTENYFLTHTRIDSILFGCVLALWRNPLLDRGVERPRPWLVVLGAVLVVGAALARNPFFGDTFRYTIQGVGLFILFSWVLAGGSFADRLLEHPALRLVGRYSYTIYLVHVVMIMVLEQAFPQRSLLVLAGPALMLTLLYGAAMFRFVERPLGRFRHRLHREPAPDPTTPLPAAEPAMPEPGRPPQPA